MGRSDPSPNRSSMSVTFLVAMVILLGHGDVVVVACPGPVSLAGSESQATIQSVHYPDDYPPNTQCEILVTAPEDYKVRLHFQNFDLESANLNSCRFDFVKVYNGQTDEASTFGVFCGQSTPPAMVSTGRYMYIYFRSDNTIERSGFSATVQRVSSDYEEPLPTSSPDSCYTVYEENSGSFFSPGYPGTYSHNSDCTYIIILPDQSTTVMLRFTSFDLEPAQGCVYDFVEVRDGVSRTSPMLGRYCGGADNRPENVIESTDSMMYVLFHTDSSAAFEGFYAEYTTPEIGFIPNSWNGDDNVPTTSICDISRAILTDRGGFIVSHDSYPESTYDHHLECSVQIAAVYDYEKIHINFMVVDLADATECGTQYSDYAEVYDGQVDGLTTSIGTVCESEGGLFETSGNFAVIRFHTDGATNEGKTGFRVLYSIYYQDNYGCQDDDFHCDNYHCISSSLVCDLFDHCGDNSDETKGCNQDSENSWGVVMGIIGGCVGLIVIGVLTSWCCMNLPTRPNAAARQRAAAQPSLAVISSNGTSQANSHGNPTFSPDLNSSGTTRGGMASPPPSYSDIWRDPVNPQGNADGGGHQLPPSPAPAKLYSQRESAYASIDPPNPSLKGAEPAVLPPPQFQAASSPWVTGPAAGGGAAAAADAGSRQGSDGAVLGRAEILRGGALPPLRGTPAKPTGPQ